MELPDLLSQIFDRVRRDLDFSLFLSALQQNNVAYYIYYLPTGNIKFVTKLVGILYLLASLLITIPAKITPNNIHIEYHVIVSGPKLIATGFILSFTPFY